MTQKEADTLLTHIQAVHGQHAAKLRKLAGDEYIIVMEQDNYHLWSGNDYTIWCNMQEEAVEERLRKSAAILQAVQG